MTFSFAPISLGHKTQGIKEASKPDFLDLDKDGDKKEPMKQAAQQAKMKKKKKNEDEPEGENGETAKMNPNMGSVKEYGMVYSNKDKKMKITPPYPASEDHADDHAGKKKKKEVSENNPAHYAAIAAADKRHRERMGLKPVPNMNDPKFKMTKKDKMTKDPMNPTGAMTGYRSKIDHTENDKNMTIREKLISVVERANHGNMDSQETYDDMYHGAGAKKMRKDHQNMKVDTTRALGVKDASAAGKVSKQAAARNSGDKTKTGDQKIVPPGTPMKDPAASKDMALENIMTAYKSMNKE